MTERFCCMVMRIHIDCNGCYRKVRRALLDIKGEIKSLSSSTNMLNENCDTRSHRNSICYVYNCDKCNRKLGRNHRDDMMCVCAELETHLIEKRQCRVSVCGRFNARDVAIKIRKKTNRRVEILEVQELNINDEHEEKPLMIGSNTWNLESHQTQIETCLTCSY